MASSRIGGCRAPCCSKENLVMDRFDFSLLFRSTIGFDRLTRLVDAATRVDSASLAYPPYNIEKTGDDAYRLTMAVAGFSEDELDITAQENTLLLTGKAKKDEDENRYLHHAIPLRAFDLPSTLPAHINAVTTNPPNPTP